MIKKNYVSQEEIFTKASNQVGLYTVELNRIRINPYACNHKICVRRKKSHIKIQMVKISAIWYAQPVLKVCTLSALYLTSLTILNTLQPYPSQNSRRILTHC